MKKQQTVSTALVTALTITCCAATGVASAASGRTFLGANVSAGLGAAVVPEREGADSYEGTPYICAWTGTGVTWNSPGTNSCPI